MYNINNSFINYTNVLTEREAKGFLFEKRVHNLLSVNGYNYKGTPKNPILWKRDISKGSDFKLDFNIEIESKYSDAKVFPSWIKRDWITRFSNDCSFKIVVCNKTLKDKLPNSSKTLLEKYNIVLLLLEDLAYYLRKLFRDIKKGVTNFLEVDDTNNRKGIYKVVSKKKKRKKISSTWKVIGKVLNSYIFSISDRLKSLIKEQLHKSNRATRVEYVQLVGHGILSFYTLMNSLILDSPKKIGKYAHGHKFNKKVSDMRGEKNFNIKHYKM